MLPAHAREKTFGDKRYDYCILTLMVLGKLETRTDLQLELREKEMCKENAKNNSERGDCIRWMTKGQFSLGEACASKHDPNKKGKGMGRPRSPSPTGSPHRNPESDGKGSDDGRAKGTPTFISKSPSGKANRQPCTNIKNLGLGIVKL